MEAPQVPASSQSASALIPDRGETHPHSSGDVRPMRMERNSAPNARRLGLAASDDRNSKSEITMKQFLDLLKTAYQVHDNIEGHLLSKGLNDMVEWIKLKGVDDLDMKPVKKCGRKPVVDVPTVGEAAIDRLEQQLQEHVATVINEGIMDSVLPLLVPPATSDHKPIDSKRSTAAPLLKKQSWSSGSSDKPANAVSLKKKSTVSVGKNESEVEIHVCDEVKHLKKKFVCSQQLLVEQMGYFAEVSRDQRLEDMDISVHCDIAIFEWLMRWLQRDQSPDPPVLETNNVIPVLVSATFLRMEDLITAAIAFCHEHMSEVLRASTCSMSALSDSILTRLAAVYSNTEVEAIRDRKDRIQSKLYCKLIQSLCEVTPDASRGHWCTMGRIFRCQFCQQLIHPLVGEQVPCIPQRMRIRFDGSVRYNHQRDPNWDINAYVISLHKATRSWRMVYWRLWGTCHFLYCTACQMYFPAKQSGWCRYHPDLPQFFVLDTQKPSLPVGRYPCCGERAYRFQILDERNGCQFREHTVSSTPSVQESAVLAMLDPMRLLVTEEAPILIYPDRLTRLIAREPTDPDDSKLETREVFWWDGLEIVPPRPKLGALTQLTASRKCQMGATDEHEEEDDEDDDYDSETSDEGGPSEGSGTLQRSSSSGTFSSSSESPDCGGHPLPARRPRERRRRGRQVSPQTKVQLSKHKDNKAHNGKKEKKVSKAQRTKAHTTANKCWQLNLSTRSNQDMQRANEEASFQRISFLLNDKTKLNADVASAQSACRTGTKQGGVWVRLEADFREKYVAANRAKQVSNTKVRTRSSRIV